MSNVRLLIAIEVFEFLPTLKRPDQECLLKRFREIAALPSDFSDFFLKKMQPADGLMFTFKANLRSNFGMTSPSGT